MIYFLNYIIKFKYKLFFISISNLINTLTNLLIKHVKECTILYILYIIVLSLNDKPIISTKHKTDILLK